MKPNKARFFLGLANGGRIREVFKFRGIPGPADVPFVAVVGPFRTRRGAQFMADHGRNNPHCLTVGDAERLAKARAAKGAA